MDTKRLKPGVMVKISDNLNITKRRFSLHKKMLEMKGKYYPINSVDDDIVHISLGSYNFAFDIHDIILETKPKSKTKPQTFNPANLVLE